MSQAPTIHWRAEGSADALLRRLRRLDHERARGATAPVVVKLPSDASDPWVAALPASISASPAGLGIVGATWAALPVSSAAQARLHRAVDDIERRALFAGLVAVRGGDESAAMAAAEAALGPGADWAAAFRRYAEERHPRLVVVPTWQCELRCRYCTIPKQGGRVMTPAVLEQSLDLLLSADADSYALHFFGGEPFLEWDLIRHALRIGERRAPGRIQYRFTTNGYALSPERITTLMDHDVHFQLSLDGDSATQNAARRTLTKGEDSYARSPAVLADAILVSGVAYDVIQVVHPSNAERADENFRHIVSLGYRHIQLNYALGARWSEAAVAAFADALHRLGLFLHTPEARAMDIDLVNLRETRMTIRTNREITVDWDGTVMSSNGFLYVPENRDHYVLGHLGDGTNFERYICDGPEPEALLQWWYPPDIRANNQGVGAVLMSFVRWMQGA
jgi:hypothetical protein